MKSVLNIETTFSCSALRVLAARFLYSVSGRWEDFSPEGLAQEKRPSLFLSENPSVSPVLPKMRLNSSFAHSLAAFNYLVSASLSCEEQTKDDQVFQESFSQQNR